MVKLMVFNRDEEYIGDVSNLISANQSIELNGEDFITFETLDNNIEKGYRILYHDRKVDRFYEYIVQEKNEYKEGNVVINDIYAENSLAETVGDFIEDKRSINQRVGHAVERALEPTRWSIGEVYDNQELGTVTFYRTNARAAINDIVEEWQLELKTEITWDAKAKKIRRKLHFLNHIGEFRGNRLTYTRDILEIKRKTLPRDIVTALYGFGKGEETESGGYGRRIDFSSINNGKSYVENNEARELWGRPDNNGKKVHSFGKVEFDNITDKERLLERTKSELEKLSKPAVSYEVKILDFFRLSGSEHDYVEEGDTVKILDRDFVPAINYNTRVLKIERDLINEEDTTITLGELVRNIADRESEQDKKIEEINDEVYWDDDDDDDDGDWGDPVYYNPSQLVKAVPSLKIGLVSWVDISDGDSVDYNSKRKVSNVRDYFTKEVVYKQDILERRPTLKNMDGRRWLSFNPDPKVLQRWKTSDGKPEDLIVQNGQYLENLLSESKAITIYIAYHDRTPEMLGEWATVENGFPAGFSSPIGYPHSGQSWYRSNGLWPSRPGQENVFFGVEGRRSYWNGGIARVRDENVVARLVSTNTDYEKYEKYQNFLSLGMNKESYDSIRTCVDDRNIYTYDMNAFFTGEIAEVIVYSREVDSREHREIIDYLTDKYSASEVLSNR